MQSLLKLEKILQDNRQEPMQSYKILQEFLESYSVLEKILQYYRQDDRKSYRTLQYPRECYKIVQDPIGWV